MINVTARSGVQMNFLAVLAGVFCLAIATGASAQEATGPCKADAAKLCNGVQPGGGAILKCLKSHESDLSPACKNNMAKAKAEIKEAKEACEGDAKKLCEGIKPGGGRIIQCLKQHESELSPSCKAEMSKSRGKRKM
jgi:Cysteine rich repeat